MFLFYSYPVFQGFFKIKFLIAKITYFIFISEKTKQTIWTSTLIFMGLNIFILKKCENAFCQVTRQIAYEERNVLGYIYIDCTLGMSFKENTVNTASLKQPQLVA